MKISISFHLFIIDIHGMMKIQYMMLMLMLKVHLNLKLINVNIEYLQSGAFIKNRPLEWRFDKELAGSGALGIECISRGAKQAVFVDSQKESLQTIKTNLKNDLSQAKLIKADYIDALYMLSKLNLKFNLVLLDPPFDSDYTEKTLYLLHKNDLLEDGAIIMCEMNSKKVLQNYPQKYIIIKNKSYGTISVMLLKYNKE